MLYVITDLNVGGVPLHLHRLVRAMGRRGFVPTVVSLAEPGPVACMMADEGVDVRDCGGRGGWDVRILGRLARIMRETEPDIVHAMLFHANLAVRLAAWEVGISPERVVCEIQTVEVQRRWHLLVDRWTHLGCRFTIGNSPSVVEHLANYARIPRDRLRLVRGGIDPEPIREAIPVDRSMLGLPVNAPVVLWVGRLDPVKGLTTLIDSLPTIAADFGAHLLLAGTGPLQEQLAGQIASVGLPGFVHLLGTRSDVPSLLKAADVFAFPSRTEGLPNALLEAMAACCPIVTCDVPGCRDLIQHDQTGLLVPYGDTAALTGAIRRLLQDRAFARRLGHAAAAAVEEQWRIDKTHATYDAVYQEMRPTK